MRKCELAIQKFDITPDYKESYIKTMKIDIGSFTYTSIIEKNNYNPKIDFYDSIAIEGSKITIILSIVFRK